MTQTYTAEDVRHLIPETLTRKQAEGVEAYLNEGKVPPADPCSGCDPNVIRKYINRIQHAERAGTWPPDGRIDGELQRLSPPTASELREGIAKLRDSMGTPAQSSAQETPEEPAEPVAEPVERAENEGLPTRRTRKPKAE